jgi:hypothetical protein
MGMRVVGRGTEVIRHPAPLSKEEGVVQRGDKIHVD